MVIKCDSYGALMINRGSRILIMISLKFHTNPYNISVVQERFFTPCVTWGKGGSDVISVMRSNGCAQRRGLFEGKRGHDGFVCCFTYVTSWVLR